MIKSPITGFLSSISLIPVFCSVTCHGPARSNVQIGHSSIQTTERYLGVDQDLTSAPCDVLGLRL